jgi:hypothetical protein
MTMFAVLLAIGMGLLPSTPWLILSPLMARWIRQRTEHALETLVSNARYATN